MMVNFPIRRRGAQPGNTNALKHGRYARVYQPAPIPGLAEHQFRDLQEEALLLRLFIARIVELYPDLTDAAQALSVFRALSAAMLSLARVVRASASLASTAETIRLLETLEQSARALSAISPSSIPGSTVPITNPESQVAKNASPIPPPG